MDRLILAAALVALVGCSIEPEPLTAKEIRSMGAAAATQAEADCIALGVPPEPQEHNGCLNRLARPIFAASVDRENARRGAAAAASNARWDAAAAGIAVAGAGLSGYAAGISAYQPPPQPLFQPTITCQTFGTITRCR